jgi:predicted DNA-binding transcriptional regulator AlpA
MAKRKPDSQGAAQMDMFGGWIAPAIEQPNLSVPAILNPAIIDVANDQIELIEIEGDDPERRKPDPFNPASAIAPEPQPQISIVPVRLPNGWENDEWWTTVMVCAYLKLGRKAIWERIRHPTLNFPQPTHFGSCRHRWRAGEVKAWADLR